MAKTPDGIVLFSGGLDSLLSALVLKKQGLAINCVHFTTPFFGRENVEKWKKTYDLQIEAHDCSVPFVKMLVDGPAHGFGKTLNPCVDCKILMLSLARELLLKEKAQFIATGEVLGQRPMSQRRDTLDIIRKKSEVEGLLLRPLCALHYPPTSFEASGLVNRAQLYGFSGRNRTPQLELAARFGITNVPAPAGGCVLTEMENGRRYWPVLKKWRKRKESVSWQVCVDDFRLARLGRQFWRITGMDPAWLCIGRQKNDNARLLEAAGPEDLTLKLADIPGPLALARGGKKWPASLVQEAAQLLAAHSQRALATRAKVAVSIFESHARSLVHVLPDRHEDLWGLPDWQSTRAEIR